MRFITCGLLLLTAAVLANAGAIGRSDDEESSQGRIRPLRRSPSAEGRTLSQLLSLKGGCSQPTHDTTEITHEPDISYGYTVTDSEPYSSPDFSSSHSARGYDSEDEENVDELDSYVDNSKVQNDDENDNDFALQLDADNDDLVAYNGRRGDASNRPMRPMNRELQEYELRRQEETNKQLRQRIQQLQRRNKQNMRRAHRARQQLRRRSRNNQRRANRINRYNRRRADVRNRLARRRLRRNNNRRTGF